MWMILPGLLLLLEVQETVLILSLNELIIELRSFDLRLPSLILSPLDYFLFLKMLGLIMYLLRYLLLSSKDKLLHTLATILFI